MVDRRPWTFVLSEYLDLPFLLRTAGEQVVAARSAREALACLDRWYPERIIVDQTCRDADEVLQFVRRHCPQATILSPDDVDLPMPA